MSEQPKEPVQFVFDTRTGKIKRPKRKPTPTVDPRNQLNDLVAPEWVQLTRSWFIEDGKSTDISKEIKVHPASFPPALAARFIRFFTKKEQRVLDPFVGVGSTLVACEKEGRKGVGIELYEKYATTTQSRTSCKVIVGDCRQVIPQLDRPFALCLTSPPYWKILTTKGSHKQKAREKEGLDLYYGKSRNDIGGITEYSAFLRTLVELFNAIRSVLALKGHLVIITQNPYHRGTVIPLAFDLVRALRKTYTYLGEMVWCQSQKSLRPYGYPFVFVPNIHHHYCLVFRQKM